MKLDTAQSLDEAFVCMTEINLATLEEALTLKKSSKARITRLKSICLDALKICAGQMVSSTRVRWNDGPQRSFPRVSSLLANSSPAAIERAFEQYILKVQGSSHARPAELQPA